MRRHHSGEGPEPHREREPQGPRRGNQPPPEQYPRQGGSQPPTNAGQYNPQPEPRPRQQWHQPPPPSNEPGPSGGQQSPPREQSAPVGAPPPAPEQQRPPGRSPQAQPPPMEQAQPRQTRSTAGSREGGPSDQPWGGGRTAPGPTVGPRLAPAGIEELVQTDVVTADRDTPIATVVAQMAEKDVGSVVVVEDEEPVGILTDRQIALALEGTPDVADHVAEDLLERDLVTGTTDMSVVDVLRRLEEEAVRRLPIIDEDGALEGIVTLDDVLVHLGTEFQNAASVIRSQSTRL